MGLTAKSDIIKNQLLSVPPYVFAAIMTVVVGFWSDRIKKRGIFNIVCAVVGVAGFVMMMASTRPAVQYVGTFLGALGIYPSISLTIAWIANNVEGVYKRGIVLGLFIGWGNLNGVVSSNVYFNGPRFFEGHAVVIGYLIIGMFGGSVLMTILLKRENKKRLAGERDYLIEGKSQEEIDALGDNRPDFLYTI
jgi:MFS family permease